VNLAARLKDGERVHVPRTGDAPVAVPDDSGRSTGMDLEKATPAGPVNINTASLEELQTLPGIGETKAKAIIAYREDKQGFKSIDELQNVTGIGPATFERLKDLITVE
jgi:competence protein ComEA